MGRPGFISLTSTALERAHPSLLGSHLYVLANHVALAGVWVRVLLVRHSLRDTLPIRARLTQGRTTETLQILLAVHQVAIEGVQNMGDLLASVQVLPHDFVCARMASHFVHDRLILLREGLDYVFHAFLLFLKDHLSLF
mmetsp:Transcript_19468/g.23078  ORF Transcript_19468/g.23078 Transcript_19468/m.23078 type:complete len:139 (+) Transcript_19468:159-575(+)